MEKERLSRRDFLKVAGTAAFSMVLPSAKEVETREPLTDLPKFITQDPPVYTETLTRGRSLIDSTLPGNSYYYPEWVHFNGLPLDILTPIRPERGYEVPGALGPVAWVAGVPHATGIYPPLMHVVVGFSQDESRMEIMNG